MTSPFIFVGDYLAAVEDDDSVSILWFKRSLDIVAADVWPRLGLRVGGELLMKRLEEMRLSLFTAATALACCRAFSFSSARFCLVDDFWSSFEINNFDFFIFK